MTRRKDIKKTSPEKLAYQKAYREANKEKISEYQHRYREENRDQLKQYLKEYQKTYEPTEASKQVQREWQKANKDKYKVWNQAWAESLEVSRYEKYKPNILQRKYGITLEQFDRMKATQNSCCACCGESETILGKTLAIDHDHATGKVRALLCTNCNTGIGHFKDDIFRLERAISYLKIWNKDSSDE